MRRARERVSGSTPALAAGAPLCAICGGGFDPAGPLVARIGRPIDGRIHVSSACLQGAAERIDQALAARRAGNVEPKTNRGLVVSVLVLGALAVLCAIVTVWRITGWPGAAVVLSIGVVSVLLACRSARGGSE